MALLLLLSACGQSRTSNPTSATPSGGQHLGKTTPTANSNAPPGSFLLINGTEAMFLAWVNTNGNLAGQTQDARIAAENNVEQIKSVHGSFTGTLTNSQVALNFGGFLGWSNIITGTYDGTTLTLEMPTTAGGVGSFSFLPATSSDFNTAVNRLQNQINDDQATATALQADQDAQATRTAVQQAEQQAVSNANNVVYSDLSSLQGYASSLNQSATFDQVFSEYAQTWQQMQNDYQTEVNDSKNGCGDGGSNYGTVQSDAGSVQSDEGSIQSDDGSYDSQKSSIDGDYSNVESFIATLKGDWQTLQQAVANNPSGTPGSNYQQSDIDKATANGNNSLNNADSVVKKAKQTRAAYDDEANNLDNKAQALPGKMGC
jgi:hypothetical protein